MNTIPLAEIKTEGRTRENYGDIAGLAASISRLGIIQPIRINRNLELVVGGRRLRALTELKIDPLIEGKHFIYEDNVTPQYLAEAELEENTRRLDMNWTERVRSIAKLHNIRRMAALSTGEQWLQSHTGDLLNVTQASVSIALTLYSYIEAKDPEICAAPSARDALSILLARKQKEATEKLAATAATRVIEMPTGVSTVQPKTDLGLDTSTPEGSDPSPVATPSSTLSNRFILGNCIEVMKTQFADASVPHIITDPPYGIDMAMLDQDNLGMANIASVEATHDVESNQSLFAEMLPEFFRILQPTGFCVLFCDVVQWQRLYDLAIATGFAVQRWPLVWLKTSPSKNGAPGHNFTKNFELAMVLRKPDARLLSPQLSSVFAGSAIEGKAKFDHPFAKPEKLWHWIFTAIVPKGSWFLDPFAGEGSSILAGLSYGLTPMGIELDPVHHSKLLVHVSRTISSLVTTEPSH